jgi:glycosyltransferase involved in cell wall biosynthesis
MNVILLDLGMELRGGQRQVIYLARYLEKIPDMRAFVACPKSSPLATAARKAKLPCILLPGRSIVNPLVLFVLLRAISRYSINIIHTHDAKAATIGSWLKSWSKKILLLHTRRVSYKIKPGIRGKKYFQADMMVGVSQEISEGLIQQGLPAGKVRTIHSGIEPSRYQKHVERDDGRFVFGAVGALTEQKGFSILIRAMSIVKEVEDLPPWEVRIVGQGPLFSALLDEAATLGVEKNLAMLGEQRSVYMLPSFDALIVPSIDGEGSSAVIKEGWAVEVPVICSALPSNEELIEDKKNGLVFAKNSPLSLGSAMVRLMEKKVLRERLVAEGLKTLLRFTDQEMGKSYHDLYIELMGKLSSRTKERPNQKKAGIIKEEPAAL